MPILTSFDVEQKRVTQIIQISKMASLEQRSAIKFCVANIKSRRETFEMLKTAFFFGSNNFSAQFIKIISHYKKIGYNINVLQQTACLVVNPIRVGNFAFLFNCTPVDRTSDSMMVPT